LVVVSENYLGFYGLPLGRADGITTRPVVGAHKMRMAKAISMAKTKKY
jgi:hypothetical protein